MSDAPPATARTVDPATREAAQWFARLRADDVTAANRDAFEAWLQHSTHHRLAYERFERFWTRTGSLAGQAEVAEEVAAVAAQQMATPSPAAVKPLNYRRYYALAASVVITIAVMTSLWPMLSRQDVYETKVGELRTVALADGSKVTLNTDTRLRIEYSQAVRSIRLERGQAYFRVDGAAARPFEVHTNKGVVRALGTEFDIYSQGEQTVVTLISGKVTVRTDETSSDKVLQPGERAALTAQQPLQVQPAPVERSTAWLTGRLIFNDEPLEQAVAEANRYSTAKIIIADEALKTLRISGVFRTGEPAEFVHTLSNYFPVTAERESSGRYRLTPRVVHSGAPQVP